MVDRYPLWQKNVFLAERIATYQKVYLKKKVGSAERKKSNKSINQKKYIKTKILLLLRKTAKIALLRGKTAKIA